MKYLKEKQAALLALIQAEQSKSGKCPCRGSNEMCGCQNRLPEQVRHAGRGE